jgi:hypothetical protein
MCAFGFTMYKDWQMRNKKIWYQLPLRSKLLLIVIFSFSLDKAKMNDPNLCKLRKDCRTVIGHGAMVLKTTSVSSFCQRQNKDHSALANCGEVKFQSFDRRIFNCKLRQVFRKIRPSPIE